MFRTISHANPPASLLAYLDSNRDTPEFAVRLRSVLTRDSGSTSWSLAILVALAFPDVKQRPQPQPSRIYDRVKLLEDWLDPQHAQQFVEAIQAGTIALHEITLVRRGGANWQSAFVAPPNNFMDRVGLVVQHQFEQNQIRLAHEPLISVSEPYYPDDASALQDWAQLGHHHGHNDGRNGHVVFLLPEARAYFTGAVSGSGKLVLTLGGSEVGRTPLMVKGAYLEDGRLHHFGGDVTEGQVELPVPDDAERLDYVLIDTDAHLYDHHAEAWSARPELVRQQARSLDATSVSRVRDALESGEGETIEFKPFADPDERPGAVREKTKFREILRTIAAFANTEGGTIFLGVQDDCAVAGIQDDLSKWGQAEVSEELCVRFKGALTNRLRDHLVGDVCLRIAFARVDSAVIAMLSVTRHENTPVSIKDDGHYYVRRGASNKQLLPSDWPATFDPT